MYLIYDTETTGLPLPGAPADHPAQPYVMQLGAALVGNDFEIIEELDELIVLPEGAQVHPKATEAHGITWRDCQNKGRDPQRVHELFSALAAKAHTLVCHNVQFDAKLWAIFCARHGFENPVRPHICTMELMTPIMKLPQRGPRRGSYKWPKCQEAYGFVTGGQQFENAHDAMADVRATAVILRWLASTGQLPRRPSEALVGGHSTGVSEVPIGAPIATATSQILEVHSVGGSGVAIVQRLEVAGDLGAELGAHLPSPAIAGVQAGRTVGTDPAQRAAPYDTPTVSREVGNAMVINEVVWAPALVTSGLAVMQKIRDELHAKRGAAAVGNRRVEGTEPGTVAGTVAAFAKLVAGTKAPTLDIASMPPERATFHIPIAHIQTR